MNRTRVFDPVSTCRIQFSEEFTFDDLTSAIPYLKKLGINTIYASPVFRAVKGSEHGYDITDVLDLNPEIGTRDELSDLRKILRKNGMFWLQDIVPNHMAYNPENRWISDIFKKGYASDYYNFFDIDWDHWMDKLKGKVLLPFFGRDLPALLDAGELKLDFNEKGFVFTYFNNTYPVSDVSTLHLLDKFQMEASVSGVEESHRLIADGHYEEGIEVLQKLVAGMPAVKSRLETTLKSINHDRAECLELINMQFYLPAFWKESEKLINYRRFFTINGLISLRMEDKIVFDTYHLLINSLLKEEIFDGLRVDHVDGLFNPGDYLWRLRNLAGEHTYIIVEKILTKNEKIKPSWPVQGNTGYDFSSYLSNLFTNEKHARQFTDIYNRWDEQHPDFNQIMDEKKHFMLFERMAGDLENLLHQCMEIELVVAQKPNTESLREAIAEFLIRCPVYKIYPSTDSLGEEDTKSISAVMEKSFRKRPDLIPELQLLQDLFLYKGSDENIARSGRRFFLRCMQFTGPLMAKGLEDTAYYSFAQFIVHNEVGDSPAYFGIRTTAFHEEMKERLRNFPLTLNAGSTHDSKRGGDSRARLTVITDIPEVWEQNVFEWRKYGAEIRKKDQRIPSLNDEYFIYQALVGSYPPELSHDETYIDRITTYILKSVREAKDNTSWAEPDEEYEALTIDFTKKILVHNGFMERFVAFLKLIRDPGMICSLSQLLLRNTCPGVPDLYRGSELWNFSLVDPDNRRPVDFHMLSEYLKEVTALDKKPGGSVSKTLWDERENGKIKLWLTWLTLRERTENAAFFRSAAYIPLEVKGRYKDNVVAFLRHQQRTWYLIAVPVQFTRLQMGASGKFEDIDWGSTRIVLPELAPEKWEHLLSKETVTAGRSIPVVSVLTQAGPGFLKSIVKDNMRTAGILMHISSLPGGKCNGDMGRHAYDFVDFLQQNGQTRWQILPLNYTDKESAYSPYSCLSAFAGNILFINPELLCDTGLLLHEDLGGDFNNHTDEACFEKAEDYRLALLSLAYRRFRQSDMPLMDAEFKTFCETESSWLDDFSLFILLRESYEGKTWNEWPEEFRDRNPAALRSYVKKYREKLDEIKFSQFLFYEQWSRLKTYANDKGIRIIGDIPFYVGFDSADVWAEPHLFSLSPDKKMEKVAGVPPDYFDEKGQLWNMPVYRWELMKKNRYTWWKRRLARNLELFDLVRIDHFRAFADFWEVPAGHETAEKGVWVEGPGEDFLNSILKDFPDMPFIAEDLGDVNQAVYELRDKFNLPGMSVLQFAFGEDMAASVHSPHNHRQNSVVYTGTHDNNTLQGWYRYELTGKSIKRLRKYSGKRINSRNCNHEMIRMAFMSVANTVIVPMQDYLGLDRNARMNKPATITGNWTWRMEEGDILPSTEKMMQRFTRVYGRLGGEE